MKVKFEEDNVTTTTFKNLQVNESFRLEHGKAIYVKCKLCKPLSTYGNKYGMFEIATGNIFEPTAEYNRVVRVNVDVKVDAPSYTPNFI